MLKYISMGIKIIEKNICAATRVESWFGVSTGVSKFRIAFERFDEDAYWIAASINEPSFLTKWLYVPVQHQNKTYWLNKQSLIKRFSMTPSGLEFLKNNFKELIRSEDLWAKLTLIEQENPSIPEPISPAPKNEEISFRDKLKTAIEFCIDDYMPFPFSDRQIDLILQEKEPNSIFVYCNRLVYVSSPDEKKEIKRYLLMVAPNDHCLGEGSYGKVFFAIDLDTAAINVVKICNENSPLREIKALLKLKGNPAVVHLHRSFKHVNNLFYIMEFCDQGDLELFIDSAERNRRPTFTFMQSLYLLFDYAYGLYSTHQSGIVHRDIKGLNLFLKGTDFYRGRTGDYGLAAHPESIKVHLAGTPIYFSPELCKKQQKLDYKKSDIWALAVTTYNLFHPESKTLPHMSRVLSSSEVSQRCASLEQDDLNRSINYLHPAVQGLFRKMLVVDPNNRADIGAVLQEIIRIGQSEGFLMPIHHNIPREFYTPYIESQNSHKLAISGRMPA